MIRNRHNRSRTLQKLHSNLLVHLDALGVADTAQLGDRLGLVTLFALISLVGGRIIPSFTRNWLAKARPEVSPPVPEGRFDLTTLVVTGLALLTWAIAPDATETTSKEVPIYTRLI